MVSEDQYEAAPHQRYTGQRLGGRHLRPDKVIMAFCDLFVAMLTQLCAIVSQISKATLPTRYASLVLS
jgi:hypothetical protein